MHYAAQDNPDIDVLIYLVGQGADATAKTNATFFGFVAGKTPLDVADTEDKRTILRACIGESGQAPEKSGAPTPLPLPDEQTSATPVESEQPATSREYNPRALQLRRLVATWACVVSMLCTVGVLCMVVAVDWEASDEFLLVIFFTLCGGFYAWVTLCVLIIHLLRIPPYSIFEAARLGSVKHVEDFVKNGADVNAKNKNNFGFGNTPLHVVVASTPQVVVLQYLLDQGADANAKNDVGRTPLHCAAEVNSNVNVLQYLLDHGANVNAVGWDGLTPLDLFLKSYRSKTYKAIGDLRRSRGGKTSLELSSQ